MKGDVGWQIVYKNQELVWARHLAWVPLELTAECLCRHGRAAQGLRKHQRKTMLYNPMRDSLHISNLNTLLKLFVSLVTAAALLWPLNDSVDITLKFCSLKLTI